MRKNLRNQRLFEGERPRGGTSVKLKRKRLIGMFTLLMLLMGIQTVQAGLEEHFKIVDMIKMTPSRPYFEFQYADWYGKGDPDALKNFKFQIIHKDGTLGGSLEGERCHDKLKQTETTWGIFSVVKVEGIAPRIVTVRYFPTDRGFQKGLDRIRFTGSWDTDDDGGKNNGGDDVLDKTLTIPAAELFGPSLTVSWAGPGELTFQTNGSFPIVKGYGDKDWYRNIYFNSVNSVVYWTKSVSFGSTETSKSGTVAYNYDCTKPQNVYVFLGSYLNLAIKLYGIEVDVTWSNPLNTFTSTLYTPIQTISLPVLLKPLTLSTTGDIWAKKIDLSWSIENKGYKYDRNGKWYIFRYKQSQGTSGRELLGTVGADVSRYTDTKNLEYNEKYCYEICYALNSWTVSAPVAPTTVSLSNVVLSNSIGINSTIESGDANIKISWTHPALKDACSFKIMRSTSEKGSYALVGTVDRTSASAISHSFVDKDVTSCTTYYYKILLNILGGDNESPARSGSINGSSKVMSLSTSKGTYTGSVKLSWTANQIGNTETLYKVSRRLLTPNAEYKEIYRVNGTTSSYFCEDNLATPGQYYEYNVEAYSSCGEEIIKSNEMSQIGFCQNTGIASGRITYGTGTSVEGVRVNLIKSDENNVTPQFYSRYIQGTEGAIKWNISSLTDNQKAISTLADKAFTIQLWINPTSNVTGTDDKGKSFYSNPNIISAGKMFSLNLKRIDVDTYEICMGSAFNNLDSIPTGIRIEAEKFSHISFSANNSGLWQLRVVDKEGKLQKFEKQLKLPGKNDIVNTITFCGLPDAKKTFKGYLDEVRWWAKSLTDEEILSNYNRLISGSEKDLVLYWTMDDGTSSGTIFDISKTGGIANENHGETYLSKSSDVVPTSEQLGLYGLTDANGNFTIRGIPLSGDGVNYTIAPAYGVHQFSPAKLSRYFNNSSLTYSGVDFSDVSSFETKGVVYYEGTTYPLEGANLYVDGNICSKDGEAIVTDSKGEFTISVPIGDHFIQIKKQGHTFVNNGRYPADPNNLGNRYTFENPKSNLTFYDNTKVTIAGRIAGGEIQKSFPHGFGIGKANIGQARITLSTGYKMNVKEKVEEGVISYENNPDTLIYTPGTLNVKSEVTVGGGDDEAVRTITILTDPETGEFTAQVCPVMYEVTSVTIPGNGDIIFDKSQFSKLDASDPLRITTDSIVSGGILQKFHYSAFWDAIHRVKPSFIVSDKANSDNAFGEKEYTYRDMDTEAKLPLYLVNSDESIAYQYKYPVFIQNNNYKFGLKAYEEYVNLDKKESPIIDRVPLKKKVVTITNQMSASQAVYVEGDKDGQFASALKENQLELDSLGEATYQFKVGFPNIMEDQEFARGLNITFDNNGQQVNWEGNSTFKGIVLGELPSGTNFVTAGPDKVLMVLRDPPGSNSNAYWEEGHSVTVSETDGGSFMTNNDVTTVTHLGLDNVTIAGTPGFGVITDVSTTNDLTVGVKINSTITSSKEVRRSVTTTKKISTSNEFDFVGASGDVFIGCATNILFGNARQVGFQKNTEGLYHIGKADVMTTGSQFGTAFNYSQNYVENTLITNLNALRNNMLRVVSDADYANFDNTTADVIYLTKLSKEDSKFGSSNSDKEVWGDQATSNTEGPSYKMILPKQIQKGKAYQDSILWYNQQIAMWVKTMADNEKAKVDAIENREKWLDTNISFDAGASIENSVQSCMAKGVTTESTIETVAVLGIETGVEILGVGVSLNATTETGGSYTGGSSEEEENCTTIGYTLAENGDDDALTVDVLRAPDGFGAIFRTRGGQTCCPYEKQTVTKYFRPGTELSAATMQIEIPVIEVTNAYANDVPSGKEAGYEIKLGNLSETKEDVWFDLAMLDETNPDGAKLSLDGAVLTNGRSILVRAGETLKKTLKLAQTDLGVLDYENIKLVLKSQCQGDPTGVNDVIADTISISAHFVPACSDITLQIDNRVMNTITSDTLLLQVKDYDMAYKNLKGIRIQYKGARDVDWKLAKEYVLKAEDKTQNNELLQSSRINFRFPMSNTALYPDQTYQFRAITLCQFGNETVNNESEIIEVIKDMSIPMILGKPTPANGIITSDNEISLTFNEAIKSSSLTEADNFRVTGILNGYALAHSVAIKLQGSNAASTEAEIDLSKRSFSVNMWVKYTSAGTLFAHGSSAHKFLTKIDNTGKMIVSISGNDYISTETIPADKWVFLSFTYEFAESESTLSSSIAYDSSTRTLFNTMPVVAYSGNGRVSVGQGLTGAIHEVTLWNKARSFAEAQTQMYTSKMASTPNLIGYWKFDEGNGTTATDVARSRHMVVGSNDWYFQNENKAVRLNGADYVGLNVGTCPVSPDEDYTLEMWFRGNCGSDYTTLFSVNDTLLNVRFTSAGAMEMTAKGITVPVTTKSYLDDAWHHFALNVLRNGSTIIYVDGEAVKQFSSAQIPALATDRIILGANRYKESELGNYMYRNFFTGNVDEVRLWKAQLAADVIRNSRINRMAGNESGLIAYYPFEKKGLDEGSQVVVNPSYEDLSTNAAGLADHSINAIINNESPGLKEVRTMTNVNFSYIASDTKIVIRVNEDPSIIEGCTLSFTVKDVRDENNNLSIPVTWSGYVSANQLKWSEEVVSIKKETLQSYTFPVTITNSSGNSESWSLTNLPSWLTVNAESGTLKPLSAKTLTFTVAPSTPIGKYEETVYLLGNNKVYEPLVVSLAVTSPAPDWSVNPADYELSMNITGQLKIINVISEDSNDLIAAFVDDKCVGVASPVYYKRYDAYYTLMDIYGNAENVNKKVNFKVWDASTGNIYPVVTTTRDINFTDNTLEGSFASPFIWNTKDMIEQRVDLVKGWNWSSTFVNNLESMDVATMLDNIKAATELVKDKSSITIPDVSGWAGTLKTLAVGKMYKMKLKENATWKAIGRTVVSSETPVTIMPNWNWVGYNVDYTMSVSDAFAGLNPENGDLVKGQTGFVTYDGYEWVGSLNTVVPGKGYLYQSKATGNKSFTYPNNAKITNAPQVKAPRVNSVFAPVAENVYPGNMTMIAVVMDGDKKVYDAEIGVFANDECRAAGSLDEKGRAFLAIAGENSTSLTFKVHLNGEIRTSGLKVTYIDDDTYGTLDAPYEIKLTPSNIDSRNCGISVYPTKVKDFVYVETLGEQLESITIQDVNGKSIYLDMAPTVNNKISCEAYAQGVYFLVVKTKQGDQMVYRLIR